MKEHEILQPIGIEEIKTKIYEIRGMKVMLDRDLAELYQVETKYLKRSVKANRERFPYDFMIEISNMEYESLRCKNCTSKKGGNRYASFAFTEEGIAMLSGLLRSEIAVQVNINIMRAFVAMRHTINELSQNRLLVEQIDHKVDNLKNYIEEILHDQNEINEDTATQLELINQTLAELQNDKIHRKIFSNRNPVGFKITE
ncbi:MAG: ORF6N domain-containing protein [Bacteroidales bacterium]|nr:ORF6N domain-containing protein [Bacteroidales bacterium]